MIECVMNRSVNRHDSAQCPARLLKRALAFRRTLDDQACEYAGMNMQNLGRPTHSHVAIEQRAQGEITAVTINRVRGDICTSMGLIGRNVR